MYTSTQELGWDVSGPSYAAVPAPKLAADSVWTQHLRSFLCEMYIVQDEFGGDHLARRHAREQVRKQQPKYSTYLEHNKLSRTNLIGTIWSIEHLAEELEESGMRAPASTLRELLTRQLLEPLNLSNDAPGSYNQMSMPAKRAYVDQLDTAAYKALQVLAN